MHNFPNGAFSIALRDKASSVWILSGRSVLLSKEANRLGWHGGLWVSSVGSYLIFCLLPCWIRTYPFKASFKAFHPTEVRLLQPVSILISPFLSISSKFVHRWSVLLVLICELLQVRARVLPAFLQKVSAVFHCKLLANRSNQKNAQPPP